MMSGGKIGGEDHKGRNDRRPGSISDAQGFYIGNDPPPVRNRDGCRQGRLPALWLTIADVFKEPSFNHGLYFRQPEVPGQRLKTLTHRAVAVVVFAMALGTIGKIEGFALFYDLGVVVD